MRYFNDDKDGFYAIADDGFIPPQNFTQLSQVAGEAVILASIIPRSAQEIADNVIVTAAKANANLILLINATQSQINAFCTTKFPTLNVSERGVLADMLLALQIVAKNILR
jgi:hypothetical protein